MIPKLAGDGLLVAGDAAALCLAAGIWLEGVNFAIASGAIAGGGGRRARSAHGDVDAAGLAGYRRRLEEVVRAARPPQAAPGARRWCSATGYSSSTRSSCATSSSGCSASTTPTRSPGLAGSCATSCGGAGCACATWPVTPGSGRGASDERRASDGDAVEHSRPCPLGPRSASRTAWPPSSSGSHPTPTSSSTATSAAAARPVRASWPARPTSSCRPPTAASSSTTSSASSAAPATSSATRRGPSRWTLPRGRPRRGLQAVLSAMLLGVPASSWSTAARGRRAHRRDPRRPAGRRRVRRRPGRARVGAAGRRGLGRRGAGRDGRPARGGRRCCATRWPSAPLAPCGSTSRATPPAPSSPPAWPRCAGRLRARRGAATTRSTAAAAPCRPTSPPTSVPPRPSGWWRCACGTGTPGEVLATRRLDRGRRERLHVAPAAVLSVEGSAARLRRATIASELACPHRPHRGARRPGRRCAPGPHHAPVPAPGPGAAGTGRRVRPRADPRAHRRA